MIKNITLSADAALIQRARKKAMKANRSLNEIFREWLKGYVEQTRAKNDYCDLMHQFKHVKSHGPYTREEMHER